MAGNDWVRIDVGYQDTESLNVLSKFIAKYSTSSPACIALVGDLKPGFRFDKHPEIQAILTNSLPFAVLNKNRQNPDHIPATAVSVYNRLGSEVFFIRISGRHADVSRNTEFRTFLPETDPVDEVELDLAEMDSEYSRLLLFVFSMAHTILWFHPDPVFTNYELRLLKVIDLARLRGLQLVCSTISKVTNHGDWTREGTLCCPRLVMVFSGYPPSVRNSKDSDELLTKVRFEQELSMRIYSLMKKCRLISIPRSTGLCFLSAKKGVAICVPEPGIGDARNDKSDTNPFASWPSSFDQGPTFTHILRVCIDDVKRCKTLAPSERPAGFPWPSHFIRPSISEWFASAIHLHSLLFSHNEYGMLLDGKLGCAMAVSRKYSKSVAAFSINSSVLQTSELMVPQIESCVHSYMQFARGPASKDYAVSLASYLKDVSYPRRQCRAVSMFGSRCFRTAHRLPRRQRSQERSGQRLPTLYHQCRSMITSFCSCGKSLDQRPEPFNVREANELFYETMDFKCCSLSRKRIDFPSVSLRRRDKKPKEEKKPETVTLKRFDSFPELSTAVHLTDKDVAQPYVEVVVEPTEIEAGDKRRVSHPAMLQLGMDLSNTEARFSSWVMYCIGNADLYRTSVGLEQHYQADFLNNYHHLIPVDAEINLSRSHKIVKRIPNRQPQTVIVEPKPWHARIYFGLEFECPRGHRFIYKSNEVQQNLIEGKEAEAQKLAQKILENGCPLFLRCPCRNGKENRQFIAQLMRIHVITPREPMVVGVFPQVKVGSGIPAFSPGVEQPVMLDGYSYFVMRLPFCYYDSTRRKGPFCAPRVSYPAYRKLPTSGALMGNFLKFSETADDL